MGKKDRATTMGIPQVPQLDAIVVLLCELLQQTSRNKEAVQIAREKAAAVLVAGGVTQERTAKLLGMQKQKVVEATKNLKL